MRYKYWGGLVNCEDFNVPKSTMILLQQVQKKVHRTQFPPGREIRTLLTPRLGLAWMPSLREIWTDLTEVAMLGKQHPVSTIISLHMCPPHADPKSIRPSSSCGNKKNKSRARPQE